VQYRTSGITEGITQTETMLDTIDKNDNQVCLDQFEWVRTLGTGGFATVDLVQIKKTKKQLALKRIKHGLVTAKEEVEKQVQNEVDILEKCTKSPFVVKYYGSIVTKISLIFILEPCLGGDLWSVMQRNGVFNDTSARFYTACVVEGLRYLTSLGIMYRDIKPENLLLDATGYVKIADLGFSKILPENERTYTVVGTAEYLSPEMLSNKGYDHTSTLWSLGILIYEMLTGNPPFTADDQKTLFSKICLGFRRFPFPSYLSSNAVELIMMLCRGKPSQRPGLVMVTRYLWFSGLDWDSLRKGTLEAPYLPELAEVTLDEDSSKFEGF